MTNTSNTTSANILNAGLEIKIDPRNYIYLTLALLIPIIAVIAGKVIVKKA